MFQVAQFTKKTGLATVLSVGLLISSAAAQLQTNTGQQPVTTSPYPSANDPLPGGASSEKSGTSGDNMDHARAKQMDRRFLQETTLSSMASMELGNLAATKASSDSVKQFAAKMVQDHTRALDYVKKCAARDGVQLPSELDSKHKDAVEKLAKLSGTEFDRAYTRYQVKHFQRRVSAYQDESDNGTETSAKTFATRMLPGVQQHLNEAKDLNKSVTATAMK